jgi:hypothetical protein
MDLEEDRPILTIVFAGLYMALILLVPAAVEAVRRGCLAVPICFVANRVAPFREGELPGEPSAGFGVVGDLPLLIHEESAHRGFYG